MPTDPTTAPAGQFPLLQLETIRYALIELSHDMNEALLRGAFSSAVRDFMDCTTVVHMRVDGGYETVANWEGCTHHAFTSQPIVNFCMAEWDDDAWQDGDVMVVNDPWRGSLHQSDINLLRPVLFDGRVEFVMHSTAHLIDLGGSTPGNAGMAALTHFEEAMKLPPMLIYANDQPVKSTFDLILENVRLPADDLGDLRALAGCLKIGERRLRELTDRYGLAAVKAAGHHSLDVTEQSLRAAIAEVPDGDYTAEDFLDDDGVGEEPVLLRGTLRVRGDAIEMDYSGTSRQPLGPVGTPWVESTRWEIGVKQLLDPLPPVNGGTMRPLDAVLPPGSAVCVLPPTSAGHHHDMGFRIVNLAIQALGKAVPDRAIACDTGTGACLVCSGVDDRPGREGNGWGIVCVPAGGWGATWKNDAVTMTASSIGDIRSAVHEHTEAEAPMVVWQHEIMPDSAGAGKFRGGFGAVYTIEALAESVVTVVTDRLRRGAPGTAGGGDGMPGAVWLIPGFDPSTDLDIADLRHCKPLCGVLDADGRPDPYGATTSAFQTGKLAGVVLQPGDAIRIVCGGGGGWGDPLERDVDAVLADVANQLYSASVVRDLYGVVVDDGHLDAVATVALRRDLAAARDRGEWSVPVACSTDWRV
ncbi:MAG TPA: hydantoinase B/oxoprolinase family protein [Acidimicrobiales bacterium]|nr:hydantoinase B/oxoprolinase family protein [Acidimicrobiales bacterium]